jgi:hypothetical protein
MRIPARTRWMIALIVAVATLSVATVAAAARWGGSAEDGADSAGQVSKGSTGDPDAPIVDDPSAPHDGDCGVGSVEPGSGPDTPVSAEPCGDDHGGLPWGDPSTAEPVEPTPGMADVRVRMFDRAIVNDDGTVTIVFTSGVEPCAVLDHVVVDYGDDVTVTLFEGHDPDAGNVACIEIAVQKSVTIALDEPLNGRDIVDGAA